MILRPVRQGISGAPGGLAAQKPFLMPCQPLTSIAWDFLPCAALRARNPTEPPCTDPYARWCDRESEQSPTYVNCTGLWGCESAHSVSRSSFRRPGLRPGYSRCERSPDKLCSCAASRRVVRTTSALPPLWRLLSPCGDNGAGIACETLRPKRTTDCALSTNNMRKKLFPCLLMDPSLCLLPELCSRGISPR